jgi:hypothetical protein
MNGSDGLLKIVSNGRSVRQIALNHGGNAKKGLRQVRGYSSTSLLSRFIRYDVI